MEEWKAKDCMGDDGGKEDKVFMGEDGGMKDKGLHGRRWRDGRQSRQHSFKSGSL